MRLRLTWLWMQTRRGYDATDIDLALMQSPCCAAYLYASAGQHVRDGLYNDFPTCASCKTVHGRRVFRM